MPTRTEQLTTLARTAGASAAAVVPVSAIVFEPAFREACKQNTCGKYGTCWTCPPLCGEIGSMIALASGYRNALVVQTIGSLEDSYDIEGMDAAAAQHQLVLDEVARGARAALQAPLLMGAGSCGICTPCECVHGKPCPYPQRAMPSLESYGIAVSQLAGAAGMRYTNGANTVTYFGAVLFNEEAG